MVGPLFVYGTLRDSELLAAVLGRPLDARNVAAATAPGYRVVFYPGRVYPALLMAPGGVAEGQLILGLSSFEFEVLDVFEGAEYIRAPIPVIVGEELHEAETYLPTAAIAADAEPWSFPAWQANHKRAMLEIDGATAAQIRQRLISVRPN